MKQIKLTKANLEKLVSSPPSQREDYSGNNGYLTVGAILQSFAVSLDYRVTDNLSDFSETSYDPWGVGSNYSRNFKGIPDPELIINIGASF